MVANIKTTVLRSGQKVLAEKTRSGHVSAVQYANRTQATKRAAALMELGVNAEVFQPATSRGFYVRVID